MERQPMGMDRLMAGNLADAGVSDIVTTRYESTRLRRTMILFTRSYLLQ
jgi:hypothetical protein